MQTEVRDKCDREHAEQVVTGSGVLRAEDAKDPGSRGDEHHDERHEQARCVPNRLPRMHGEAFATKEPSTTSETLMFVVRRASDVAISQGG